LPFVLPVRHRRVAVPAALLVSLLGVQALMLGCHREPAPAAAPPQVTVAHPTQEMVADDLVFTGNTAPIDAVTLVARVEGYLETIHFTDGATVKKGDLLFTIQQDQYKAQLEQAQAAVAAQRAALVHAETELQRYSDLVKVDSAPQTQVDRWQYERDSALAALHSAEGQVVLAKLNLDYTQVRAPFDGRMGRHLIDVGNLVGGPGQPSTLAEIQRIDPLYVYFTIDERALLRLREQHHAQRAGALAGARIPAAFGLLDETDFPHAGELDFASLGVAPRTGTLQVRAVFPNPEPAVLPGLFARVRIPTDKPRPALTMPGDAIAFDQQGQYVLVVNDANVVERRAITTGAQVGERYVVESGLQLGDRVIVEGLARAIPGRVVQPEPAPTGAPPAAAPPQAGTPTALPR
jgi:RND family efflux transporter MFP subunit